MDDEGWLDLSVISSFNRIKCLSTDLEFIKESISHSEIVEERDGKIRKKIDWEMWIFPAELKASMMKKKAETSEASIAENIENLKIEETNNHKITNNQEW